MQGRFAMPRPIMHMVIPSWAPASMKDKLRIPASAAVAQRVRVLDATFPVAG